jgi:C-terminal processing protease CtpA/Prc
MRVIVTFALAVALAALGSATRAEDQPEGSIGVKIDLRDGKIVVAEPIKGSPAEKAGIKADDVIVKVGDFQVKDNAEEADVMAMVQQIVKLKPGTKVKVEIKRDGKDMTIEVTVGKRSEIIPKDKD